MLLAHRILHCCFFGGKAHVTNRMSQKRNWHGGKTPFPSSFERLPVGSQEGGIPWCWHTLATLAQTPCDMEKLKFSFHVLFSFSPQHRNYSLKPRDLLEPDPPKLMTSMSGNLDFPVSPLRWHPSKEEQFIFLACGSSVWHFCHFHFHFLKVRVGLWKVVKQHAKCKMSTLSLNFPCLEHHMKISLGFIVAFFFFNINLFIFIGC